MENIDLEKQDMIKRLYQILMFICLLSPFLSEAATPDFWSKGGFSYEGNSTPLDVILKDYADSHGVELVMSDYMLNSMVEGWHKGNTGSEFLNKLGLKFKFQWFVYMQKLFISSNNEIIVQKIKVDNITQSALEDALKGVGLLEDKFNWGYIKEKSELMVSGPPAYIDFLRELVEYEEEIVVSKEVMLFPLKYASVNDREVNYRQSTFIIPGVANLLKSVLSKTVKPENQNTSYSKNPISTAKSGLFNREGNITKEKAVLIEGDVRTNTLLIYDDPAKKGYYEELVKQIDVEKKLIEIEAIIVDIDRSSLEEFGVDWEVSNGEGSSVSMLNNLAQLSVPGAMIQIADRLNFQAMLRALESKGNASFVANTTILTVENQPAIFDSNETRFIQTVGERVADLREVTAGTLLNIIPRHIESGGRNDIQLSIEIEDGQIIQNSPDGLPVINKININTTAIVQEGRSIVVGGYKVQSERQLKNKVPLLGSIPLIGKAFSYEEKVHGSRERIFILTPRISVSTNQPVLSAGPDYLEAYNQLSEINRSTVGKNIHKVFRTIANGKLPVGYKVNRSRNEDPVRCEITGVAIIKNRSRRLESDFVEIMISTIRNESKQEIGLNEHQCKTSDMIAMSYFPYTSLKVGQETDIIVARIKNTDDIEDNMPLTALYD